MRQRIASLLLLSFFVLASCKSTKTPYAYTSETLQIVPLSDKSFMHISYLQTDSFGKVACNGLIYMNGNEAVVVDTPTENKVSEELIEWITDTRKKQLKAVIANHFHDDCVGGLQAFHEKGIPSYGNYLTLQLAEKEGNQVPQNGFEDHFELQVGNGSIINQFLGEGHTRDNIVSYVPEDQLLFGGCLVKEMDATKGYLGDANVAEWSTTALKIKSTFSQLKIVVPGHGNPGGIELLDYTAQLFQEP
ncbi:subclass B1 metallo-beta-lactamase [Euzebyella marina]|uniref:Beta-lactamase n=1 Tax=Euzebyella marina TaxID=1761453 RepID=A0A3G2L3R6_9FLAO|nr:subclass B1 metallo-beta-lactamase [Euzebyella marina]AYN66904.1 subclass B1 metallo-beta-lactamase [Euzebyella marina]